MEDQLISFETAKLAKEKGFKEQTIHMYDHKGKLVPWIEADYLAPTQSLLQKWLREEYNIHIVVPGMWSFVIKTKENDDLGHGWDYKSYEEALEAGLQEALKLI